MVLTLGQINNLSLQRVPIPDCIMHRNKSSMQIVQGLFSWG